MLCYWRGNRRYGVALSMRHRLKWFINVRAHGLRKGDEHPAYNPCGVWHTVECTMMSVAYFLTSMLKTIAYLARILARYTLCLEEEIVKWKEMKYERAAR